MKRSNRPPDPSLYRSRPIQVFCATKLPSGGQKCGQPMVDAPDGVNLVCRFGHRVNKAEFVRRVEQKRTGRR